MLLYKDFRLPIEVGTFLLLIRLCESLLPRLLKHSSQSTNADSDPIIVESDRVYPFIMNDVRMP